MESSWATSPAARKAMQGNRSRDTKPELAVRRLLHVRGFRYRVNARPIATLPRTADIVFTRAKIAIFIDGCYWHGCPLHYRAPASNVEYWTAKLARNLERDRETSEMLRLAGWTVLRFWAHQDPVSVTQEITDVLPGRASEQP